MFMLPEFNFDHVLYELSDSQFNEAGLLYAYGLCRDFLRLKVRAELGFTAIVSQ
jgi:hypothetical protein